MALKASVVLQDPKTFTQELPPSVSLSLDYFSVPFCLGFSAVCYTCFSTHCYVLRDSHLAWPLPVSLVLSLKHEPQLCPCLAFVFGYTISRDKFSPSKNGMRAISIISLWSHSGAQTNCSACGHGLSIQASSPHVVLADSTPSVANHIGINRDFAFESSYPLWQWGCHFHGIIDSYSSAA